jgi:hypothetical protein
MIVICSVPSFNHGCSSALGHEIGVSRHVVFDMYYENFLDKKKDIIVTNNNDRKFLYTNIFDNVISYEDFLKQNIDTKEILDLTYISGSYVDVDLDYFNDFTNISGGYPLREKIFCTTNFNYRNILNQMDYINIDNTLVKKKFILIHVRTFDNEVNVLTHVGGTFNQLLGADTLNKINIEITNKILTILKESEEIDIIIYTKLSEIEFINKDIKIINDLNLYASLINHTNCLALISEISGCGELGFYCHNKNIYFYGNHYPTYSGGINFIDKSIWENRVGIRDAWNIKCNTNAIVKIFTDVDDMLLNIKF